MELTIIIVNWNTRNVLMDCLNSLKQYIDDKKVKIIVVDNSSHDGSREMVSSMFPDIKLINSGGNIGFGRANNIGLTYTNSPFILFLNPDTIIKKNSIQKMLAFMKSNPLVGALSCKLKYGPNQKKTVGTDDGVHRLGLQWYPTPLTQFVTLLFLSDRMIQILKKFLPYKNPHQSGYVSKLYGTALMVRKEILDQIGAFDERFFMYGEDVDLSRRIINEGWKLYYLSEAEIIHLAGAASEIAANDFATLMSCESIYKYMYKYYGNIGKYSYKAVIFSGALFRLLIITILSIIFIKGSNDKKKKNKNSFNKYISMIKWSLNLRKPEIKQ